MDTSNLTKAVFSIAQGVIAVLCVAGTFLLVLNKQEIPLAISTLDGAVVGYFFAVTQTLATAHAVVNAQNGTP
jgi:hypothetical protein